MHINSSIVLVFCTIIRQIEKKVKQKRGQKRICLHFFARKMVMFELRKGKCCIIKYNILLVIS